MLGKKINIIFLFLITLFTLNTSAFAEICDNEYKGMHFYLVKIGFSRVACYYGKKNVYYQKMGEYVPVSGLWQSDGSPYFVGCLSDNSADCVFKHKN